MDADILQGFIEQAEEYLPLIRGGILVCAQTGGVYGEVSASLRQIAAIKNSASILALNDVETVCAEFERQLKSAVGGAANYLPLGDDDARRLLDKLAELEVLVAEIYFSAGDFSESISNFIDESFGQFEPKTNAEPSVVAEPEDDFEIDDEMLEVFALEADELIKNFRRNLEILEKFPARRHQAMPELRRSAHTLKGSAGIVGMKTLPQLAHRVEDLLDCLESKDAPAEHGDKIFELLITATDCFESLASGEKSVQLTKKIARIYESSDELTASRKKKKDAVGELQNLNKSTNAAAESPAEQFEKPKSVVRVSLDKLDELMKIVDGLSINRSTFERSFAEFHLLAGGNLESLFESQCRLIDEIQEKLLRLRTVRFGSLAGRLQRTVRVACEEEEKRAELVIEGENLEIDTQILDGFVEPLLHLLRNAVAHGVEAPDLRRLLNKPETGRIFLRAESEAASIVVTISDDGRGISADALREKAVASGFLNRSQAQELSDVSAFELMFLDGLTTAEHLSQTAGRGVGMNAVKTCVERHHGSIAIESEARKGTTFTVRLPTVLPSADSLSVLIVDDSPSIRRATAGVIKSAGWQSQTAENGVEALEILRAARRLPDVILTDAEMPQMDGFTLLNALKSQASLQAIPVVMITSRGEDFFRRRAVDLGVSDFFIKPCDNAVLLDRIRSLSGIKK